MSVRAEHVEQLLMGLLVERLAEPHAAELLRGKTFDTADAEKLRTEETVLLARLDEISDERADGLLTGQQAQRASALREKLDVIVAQQVDQNRKRVLDGLPLGRPQVAEKVEGLSPDRLRAVFELLMTITVLPVGKGGRVFDPDRVDVRWK